MTYQEAAERIFSTYTPAAIANKFNAEEQASIVGSLSAIVREAAAKYALGLSIEEAMGITFALNQGR